VGSVWEREILIPRSRPIGPQIGNASASQKVAGHVKEGMGRAIDGDGCGEGEARREIGSTNA